MRILVTGSSGQVGREIELALLNDLHEVVLAPHKSLDITNFERVRSAVFDTKVHAIINAAAYTNVEKAEDDYIDAYAVNALGAGNLAKAAFEAKVPLVHISTDYVFSKETGRAHVEDEKTCVKSAYGKTKLAGEELVISSGCSYAILRTSWIFGPFGHNFVKTMLRVAQDKDLLKVVCDQQGSPTPASEVAKACVVMAKALVEKPELNLEGIYHFAGTPYTTWDEFARVILAKAFELNLLDHEVSVQSILSEEYPSKVERPLDSRLDCTKIYEVFGLKMPYWEDYLEQTLKAG